MRIRTRVLLSLLVIIGLMTVPAVYAAVRVHEIRGIALAMRKDAARTALTVGRLRASLSDLDRLQRAYVATADPDVAQHVDRTMAAILSGVETLHRYGYGDDIAEAGFPLTGLQAVTDSLATLVRAGELEAATHHVGTVARPLLWQADAAVADVSRSIDRSTFRQASEADELAASAARATTTAILLALVVALVLALLSARILTRPLDRLRRAMAGVAEGRFEPPSDVAYERPDELGDLFRSFRTMSERLAELDRTKAELVGIASHDLKTPISVIAGYAELMEEELSESLGQRHRQALHALWEQTHALGSRVNQLIEISRMEAGGLRLGLEEINTRHFARSLEREFAAPAAAQGIQLRVVVHPAAPSFMMADPDALRQEIVGHLIRNALKFTPREGTVEVRLGPGEPGRVVIEVEDQGPMIPEDEAPFVFDRYYRSREASGRVGSGLDLPIARAGALAHGGSIEAVSGAPSGMTVRVDLPLRSRSASSPERALSGHR